MFEALRRAWRPKDTTAAQLDRARALSAAGQHAEALAIWRPLAEAGVPRAQGNLGACYATGSGLPANFDLARHWLHRAAEAGQTVHRRNLASLLLPHDPAAAAEHYRIAAEAGDAASQEQLSAMLMDGAGVTADAAEAHRWALAAAGQGVSTAAARLGTMFHEGLGVSRDPGEAAQWWRVAAEAGHAEAAAMLGAAYHLGQGVAADQVEAMAWLLVGSARHSVLVRPFFAVVQAGLSEAELEDARARAGRHGWTASPV